MGIFAELESEVRGYCRDYDVVFTRAKGSKLYDGEGNEYIDFLAGAGSLNYGHNNDVLKQAVIEYLQEDGVLHGLDMHTAAKAHFLRTFSEKILEPRGLDYKMQFTGPTGTNAVEAALKLARKVTGRQNIVSFTNGFHGVSLGSVAATGNGHHRGGAGVPLTNTTFMPFAGYFGSEADTIAYIERLLEDSSSGVDMPAAMILETIQGEGGVNVASAQWLQRLQAVCNKHDILLIVDDIQVGCGRTGTFFSFEEAGIKPDIITLSKSLGGIGLPMALVLMRPDLDQWEPGEHNGTFRGNNLAFVAASKAITEYWSDDSFGQEVLRKGAIVRQHFGWFRADNRHLGARVRGRGMVHAIEFPIDGVAAAVVEEAFKHNLIIENCGSGGRVIKFLGSLTMEEDVLLDGLKRLGTAINAVAARVKDGQLQESAE